MKPIIGLNLDVEAGPPEKGTIQANYYNCILRAGGIPVLVPPMSDADLDALLARIDGLMFIGGDDYCPSAYGEQPHQSVECCHPIRDEFDARLIKKGLEINQLPILGICAGAQLLNIALGGNLIQDIASENESAGQHRSFNGWQDGFTRHEVKLDAGTELADIYKSKEIDVVSSHHQAIRRLGRDLIPVAWACDGIIEAIESKTRPFTIGVQWHPERDYDGNVKLFCEFVERCARPRRQ